MARPAPKDLAKVPAPNLGDILSHALSLEKQGYKPNSVRGTIGGLKALDRRVNLLDVQGVLIYLARVQLSPTRKEQLSNYLEKFYRWKGVEFQKPRYKRVIKLPFIPTENEVDQLIGGVGKKTAAFLELLKQTGVRAGEAWALKWIDIDPEKSTANILPEKGSNARQLRITGRLMAMLNGLPHKSLFIFHLDDADQITSLDHFRRIFDRQRKKVAERLENPRIMQIHWHTLRHFRASVFYHQTRDILATMQMLGHKNIRNTLIYTHLIDWESDEFISKVGKTVKEAQDLVEAGFDYVCDVEGCKLFRKRK